MGKTSIKVGVLKRAALAIEHAKCPADSSQARYRIEGEPGLLLVVTSTGHKTWQLRYAEGQGREGRRQRIVTLGNGRALTLTDAVAEKERVLVAVAKGENFRTDATLTLDSLFHKWLAAYAKGLKTRDEAEARYSRHIRPRLGRKLATDVTRADIRQLRDSVAEKKKVKSGQRMIWSGGPAESDHCVALLSSIFNWAVDEDVLPASPAIRIKKLGGNVRRERFLDASEIRLLWREWVAGIRGKGSAPSTMALALQFTLLTGARISEVLGLTVEEIEGLSSDRPVWRLPAQRAKNALAHSLPLGPVAIGIINQALKTSGTKKGLVFLSERTGKALDRTAAKNRMQRTMAKLGLKPASPHDLRRTVGTLMGRLGISTEVRGYVFNHVTGAKSKVTSWNYDASEHDHEKHNALTRWEAEVARIVEGSSVDNVVPLRVA